MAKLGDFLSAINYTKKNVIDEDPLAEREYVPFVTNRTLSYFIDTVIPANEMNTRHFLDNKPQFDYLLNSIRTKKRFSRWLKPEQDKDLEAVKEYYGYSFHKANEALKVLSGEQLSYINERLEKGGMTHGKRKKGT